MHVYLNKCRIDVALCFGRQCPPVVSSLELFCRFLSALYSSGEYEKCLPPTSSTHAYAHTHTALLCLSDSNPRERSEPPFSKRLSLKREKNAGVKQPSGLPLALEELVLFVKDCLVMLYI